MLTGEPWVRWPPAARSRPMKVSPGCSSARNTAWFIWLPEFGCTLAKPRAEQFLGALDRQRLGDIDPFAAAVIARARIALGIFVGHHRALRFQHRAADDVFRRDQLDLVTLATEFAPDRGGDFRIGLLKRGGKERVGRGGGLGRWLRKGSWAKYLHRRSRLGAMRPVTCGDRKRRWRNTISGGGGQALAVHG